MSARLPGTYPSRQAKLAPADQRKLDHLLATVPIERLAREILHTSPTMLRKLERGGQADVRAVERIAEALRTPIP